jgi:aldose sugar dehydrogenase
MSWEILTPLNKNFAHGVRNGFGIDFDPVNGNLWDTENGPGYGDEINLVEQGWGNIQGFWTGQAPHPEDILLSPNPEELLTFGGKSEYSHPSIGFTALTFLNTVNYGRENNIVVGDFHQGNLYLLTLNENRTDLQPNGRLSDKMANNMIELKDIILGQGFGGITDIEIGPDGNIYVLSLYQGGGNCELDKPEVTDCIEYDSSIAGTIFRIIPANLLVP